MTLKRLAAKITLKNAHLITLCEEKSGTVLFKALKTGFVENKGQSGPLSADSKTQGKCQLSVKFSAICQLSVKILAICQLSVNPIQALFWMCYSAPEHLLCLAAQRESSRPSKWTIEQGTVLKGFQK